MVPSGVATNLRLRPEAEAALRDEAARTGRSQQELIREAIDQYLRLAPSHTPRTEAERLVASGSVLMARSAFRESDTRLTLPRGTSSADLLDREDRL